MSIRSRVKKTTDSLFNESGELQVNTKKLIGLYSLAFVLLSIGIFILFLLLGRTFIQFGDGYRQGYFWIAELKHNLTALFSGGSYPLWSWSKGTGLEVSLPVDPFNILAALFPWKHLELGYTIAIVIRMYLSGLAFIALTTEEKMKSFNCLLGAILYTFSSWAIGIALLQGRFVIALVLLPILILSVDRIYKGKSPLIFIFTVAYFLIINYYLAYMAALITIIFIFLRYFKYCDKFSFKKYIQTICKFLVYGICGVLISAFALLQSFLKIKSASMESSTDGVGLIYDGSFYLSLGKHLISEGFLDGYSYLGVPIFALIVIAVSFRKLSIKNTPAIISLILFAMMLFPFFSSMFNGFSYSSGRWYYLAMFFAIWTATASFDLNKLAQKANLRIVIIAYCILTIWSIGLFAVGLISLTINALAFIAINVLAGFALLLVIRSGKEGKVSLQSRQVLVVVISCITLVIAWNGSLYGNMGKFVHDGDISYQLERSSQRVSNMVDDNGFYRTDQVNWINVDREMKMPANENLWWQSKSIYLYDSKIPETLFELNGLVGNNYGYSKRVYMLSNDNRAGLDYLYGVKYFLGNDEKYNKTGADQYAGYGFEYKETIDGIHILDSKYNTGLGFVFDKYITKSQFKKLSRLEREQALLQAVVIPDENADRVSFSELKSKDIETDVEELKYEIIATDGVELIGNKIVVSKEGASFELKTDEAFDKQIFMSFDNLIKGVAGSTVSGSFNMECESDKVTKSADNEQTNQSIYGVKNYDLNMGYFEKFNGKIRISFSEPGEYHFDKMYVSAMNMELYDKYASALEKTVYDVSEYGTSSVIGTVTTAEDGMFVTSIPKYDNWDIYVDGKKAEKYTKLDIAFMGTEISSGKHTVELKYNYSTFIIGIAVSIVGLLMTLIIGIIYRRKNYEKSNYLRNI